MQLYASTDVLIGEYRPHEPTHTETRLADESLSTSAKEITEDDEQKRGKENEKGDPQSWGKVRSQEECEVLRSVLVLPEDVGDDGPAGQSSPFCTSSRSRRVRSCLDASERLCFDSVDLYSVSSVGLPDSCRNLALTKLFVITTQQQQTKCLTLKGLVFVIVRIVQIDDVRTSIIAHAFRSRRREFSSRSSSYT
jgi:hypothetical protein